MVEIILKNISRDKALRIESIIRDIICDDYGKTKKEVGCETRKFLKKLARKHLEYQLISMARQVSVETCCTVARNKDLKKLMNDYHIRVIRGASQLWQPEKDVFLEEGKV